VLAIKFNANGISFRQALIIRIVYDSSNSARYRLSLRVGRTLRMIAGVNQGIS
jgi:hypothetical protein